MISFYADVQREDTVHIIYLFFIFFRLFSENSFENSIKEHGERTVYTILEFFNFLLQHSMGFLNFLLHFFLVSFFLSFLAQEAIILRYTVNSFAEMLSVSVQKLEVRAGAQSRGAKIKLPPATKSRNYELQLRLPTIYQRLEEIL